MFPLAVLLGMEDVLCSTGALHRQSWQIVLAQAGIPVDCTLSSHALRQPDCLNEMLRETGIFLSDAEKKMLLSEKKTQYRQLLANLSSEDVLPGVRDLLAGMRERRLRLCLTTLSKNAVLILKQLALSEMFDVVCDGNDAPEPDIYHFACARAGVRAQDALVWENVPEKREAARRLGFAVVSGGARDVMDALGWTDSPVWTKRREYPWNSAMR